MGQFLKEEILDEVPMAAPVALLALLALLAVAVRQPPGQERRPHVMPARMLGRRGVTIYRAR
jgi:MYXO-CTERM domain-containing protein